MASQAPFLVLFLFILGLHKVETARDILNPQDASFCYGRLEVIYPELDISKCLIVPKDQNIREKLSNSWKAPLIHFPGAQKEKKYILVMVDPDAPSRAKHTSAYWRHWLVVNIKADSVSDFYGNALKKKRMDGKTLTDYHPPTPPHKSGFHRYQFLLFEQPPHTTVSLTEEEKSSRGKWDFQAFIIRFNLGEPAATLQFLTQNFKD